MQMAFREHLRAQSASASIAAVPSMTILVAAGQRMLASLPSHPVHNMLQGGKAPSQDAPSSAVRTDSSSSAGAAPPPGLPLDEPAAAAGDAWHQLADMSRVRAQGLACGVLSVQVALVGPEWLSPCRRVCPRCYGSLTRLAAVSGLDRFSAQESSEFCDACLQDAAEGRRVLDFLLAYLDEKGSWTARDGRLDATLGRLRKVSDSALQHA